MGRPSTYTPKIADKICERIASGETLLSIDRDASMPPRRTIYRWLKHQSDDPDEQAEYDRFRHIYREARIEQWEGYAEEIIELSDNETGDLLEDESGSLRPNTAKVQRDKLRVHARQWTLARRMAKVFGDRVEHTGQVGVASVRMKEAETVEEALEQLSVLLGENDDQPDYLGDL